MRSVWCDKDLTNTLVYVVIYFLFFSTYFLFFYSIESHSLNVYSQPALAHYLYFKLGGEVVNIGGEWKK